mgnify:CR=1 FL=1
MPRAKRDPATLRADFWGYARSFLHVHMRKVRRLSDKTVESYRISLECLISYLEGSRGLERRDIGFDHLEYAVLKEWLAWMVTVKKYSPKTIDLRLTAVRSFLRYCSSEDVGLTELYNRSRELKGPKKGRKPIDYMSEPATAAVLGAFTGATAKHRRNRAMLILLYDSGARISELVDACVCDLSMAAPPRIILTGKGNKTRVVPLMERTAEHMRVYLDEFHPGWERSKAAVPLFYCNRGGVKSKLSVDTVASTLKKAASIARETCLEVPRNVHCHMMRKTRAMDLYKQGVPLPTIMQLLGHESMSTTSGFYAFATDEMMFAAIASAQPVEVSETPKTWMEEEKLAALYSLR